MSSHTEFQLQMMFQTLNIDLTTPNIKICTTHHKIINRDIDKFCLLMSGEGMFKFPLPTVFQN